jgi:lysophospholipase L1-like esterase
LTRLLAVVVLVAGSCTFGSASRPAAKPSPTSYSGVYVALGASETAGIGTRDSPREAFPERLLQLVGPGVTLYNFGIARETTEAALRDELPQAVALHPALATVWFNVDDLVAGVSVDDFESRLDQIVGALRRAGAHVLVANTPQLEHLPAYAACRPDPPPGSVQCPLGSVVLPPPDQVATDEQAYNVAIAAVVAREGAVLVDLYAAGDVPDEHPGYVSRDGFHPSAEGASAIAMTFATTLGVPLPSPSPSRAPGG